MRSPVLIMTAATLLWLPPLGAQGSPQLPLSVWWGRNQAVLLDGAEAAVRTGPTELPLVLAARQREECLTRLRQNRGDAEFAALRLGRASDARDLFTLLETVKRGGRVAESAVLALGLFRPASGVGHLRALMEDGPVGRHMSGDPDRAVAPALRIAAAVALGLAGEDGGYAALEDTLDANGTSPSLAAACLVGLSFSSDHRDAGTIARRLIVPDARPLVREAAAAALGRQGELDGGARRLLANLIDRDPAGGGRGAAVSFWYGADRDADSLRALTKASREADDAITRVLAMVALAGGGHDAVRDAVEEGLRATDERRGYAIVALGLLGRSRPELADWGRAKAAEFASSEPEAVGIAARLFGASRGGPRPTRGRSLAHLAGGNAAFQGAPQLGRLLDLAARLSR